MIKTTLILLLGCCCIWNVWGGPTRKLSGYMFDRTDNAAATSEVQVTSNASRILYIDIEIKLPENHTKLSQLHDSKSIEELSQENKCNVLTNKNLMPNPEDDNSEKESQCQEGIERYNTSDHSGKSQDRNNLLTSNDASTLKDTVITDNHEPDHLTSPITCQSDDATVPSSQKTSTYVTGSSEGHGTEINDSGNRLAVINTGHTATLSQINANTTTIQTNIIDTQEVSSTVNPTSSTCSIKRPQDHSTYHMSEEPTSKMCTTIIVQCFPSNNVFEKISEIIDKKDTYTVAANEKNEVQKARVELPKKVTMEPEKCGRPMQTKAPSPSNMVKDNIRWFS